MIYVFLCRAVSVSTNLTVNCQQVKCQPTRVEGCLLKLYRTASTVTQRGQSHLPLVCCWLCWLYQEGRLAAEQPISPSRLAHPRSIIMTAASCDLSLSQPDEKTLAVNGSEAAGRDRERVKKCHANHHSSYCLSSAWTLHLKLASLLVF